MLRARPDEGDVPDMSEDELFAVMADQASVNEWIYSFLDPDEVGHMPEGFGSVEMDPMEKSVTLAWKGDLPADIQHHVDSPPAGVTVTVIPARYTAVELDLAATQVMQTSGDHLAGWTLESAAPRSDASGLHVTATRSDHDKGDSSLGSVTTVLQEVTAVDVYVAVGEPIIATQGNRWNPTSPWRSGAALTNSPKGTPVCSSGWGGKGSDGQKIFLTAAHCGLSGNYFGKAGASPVSTVGPTMGPVYGYLKNRDTLIVGVPKGKLAGKIYDGPWNAKKSDYRVVGGAGPNVNGNLVCGSGAMSGVHCPLKITNARMTIKLSNGWTVSPIVQVQATSGGSSRGIAWATGDSGGPVFVVNDPNSRKREARGIISAGSSERPCPSLAWTGQTCFATGYYADMQQALRDYKMKLKKG